MPSNSTGRFLKSPTYGSILHGRGRGTLISAKGAPVTSKHGDESLVEVLLRPTRLYETFMRGTAELLRRTHGPCCRQVSAATGDKFQGYKDLHEIFYR